MSKTNTAVFTDAAGTPLRVGPSPYPHPGPNEVLIHVAAVAVNPVDAFQASNGILITSYPYILGCDCAGTIAEVGSNVTTFQPGQRVIAMVSASTHANNAFGAYQEYTLSLDLPVCPIPDSITFEDAVVLPLALATAAAGLYPKHYLGLELPSLSPKKSGKTLLLWGGSSSVGCCAIQLAVSSGYNVVATSSPRNFDLCKRLGAREVFDHGSEEIVEELTAALKLGDCVGAFLAIASPAITAQTAQVLSNLGGGFIATVFPPSDDTPLPDGVKSEFVQSTDFLKGEPGHVHGKAVWEDFLPKALESGKFVPAPRKEVAGKGLEGVEGALEAWRNGVSGKKIVVSL